MTDLTRPTKAQPLPVVPLALIVSEIDQHFPNPEAVAVLRFFPQPVERAAKHED